MKIKTLKLAAAATALSVLAVGCVTLSVYPFFFNEWRGLSINPKSRIQIEISFDEKHSMIISLAIFWPRFPVANRYELI